MIKEEANHTLMANVQMTADEAGQIFEREKIKFKSELLQKNYIIKENQNQIEKLQELEANTERPNCPEVPSQETPCEEKPLLKQHDF